ncbi:MAG: DUF5060 domain-containing protein [Oscillospiraceae bacterium]|nr:DUF5060 domain-containing protein [Oscillospiraceae bacterium]
MDYCRQVERWGVFEASLRGRQDGNPFTDYSIAARFTGRDETVDVFGFYDGNGVYKVRFMPGFCGSYQFTVQGTFSGQTETGSFEVVPAAQNNHGPVRTIGFHFAYEDGTPYYPV